MNYQKMTREQRRTLREHRLAMVLVMAFMLLLGICLGSAVTAIWWVPEPEVVTEIVYVGTVSPMADMATEDAPEVADEAACLGAFTITHYCACMQCCGKCDGLTATGTQATEGRTVAVDPEVIPYGSVVRVVYEDGTAAEYIAEDCGGAIRGNRLDVFMASHADALAAGVKTGVVYVEVMG